MNTFAEVILPLPLYSTFTYSVPEEMERLITPGARVLVQFGRKKYYTGLIESIHHDPPEGYEVKPIMTLMDTDPVIRYPQFKLWNWIAEYYLCSLGEVYKAAVPSGLKPESETFISLHKDYDSEIDFSTLPEKQAIVIQALNENKRWKISDLEKETSLSNLTLTVNQLLEAGIVRIDEHIVERYRPQTKVMVGLTIDPSQTEALHDFFNRVNRSRQQEKALITYLDISRFLNTQGEPEDVSKEDLMKKADVSPAIIKALETKGIFRIYKKSFNRFKNNSFEGNGQLARLSEIQSNALESITAGFREKDVILLHGVTGSGKTEIYTHLIKRQLNAGNQVLYLVPEISLTTQLTDRLRSVFGDRLVVYHSKFSDNERVDIWKRLLHTNEPLVILGVRSSVFLPFAHLGLVIIDEEHESSFKQYDPAPRYNARDAAMVLSRLHGAKTLLGSATPSVETYYKAVNGKFGLVELNDRFEGASLPDVEIIDMRDTRKRKAVKGAMSITLYDATRKALEEGQQAIMFQNRRGFAPVVVCKQCGWVPKCENCDVALVYHKQSALLRCHYCGFTRTLPNLCPACGENAIEVFGYGTERIAEEMHREFEGYRVARMDLDTTRNKDAFQEIIEEFSRKETDILVGTQMVTKGLDFDKVNIVGVLNADTLLNFPDFRSNERAFNMLEQVAGRAGRRKDKGTVLIQTTSPSDRVLLHVKNHDFKSYYKEELEDRRKLGYPPFTKIINIYLRNKDSATVDSVAVTYTLALRNVFGDRILGPEKPFVSRVATWYIQCVMLKVETDASMKKVKSILRTLYESLAHDPRFRSTQIYYDVDPV